MVNLVEIRDKSKAVADIVGLSPTARLIANLILLHGTSRAPELVALSGLPRSTVYRVLNECYEQCGEILTSPTHGNSDAIPCPTRPTSGTSENPTSPNDEKIRENSVPLVPLVGLEPAENPRAPTRVNTTGATNELPSEVVISKKEDSPSSVPPIHRKPTPRGKRLAIDWQLPDDWREWARISFAHASAAMIAEEAEKFRDYWTAKAGHTACKLDWLATWRNWCRTAFAAAPSRQPVNHGRMSWDEQRAARNERARALIASLGSVGTVQ